MNVVEKESKSCINIELGDVFLSVESKAYFTLVKIPYEEKYYLVSFEDGRTYFGSPTGFLDKILSIKKDIDKGSLVHYSKSKYQFTLDKI